MNFKSFIALLLCCGLATMGVAQCPTTDISFNTQADIDNFSTNYPGCTMIPANVIISDVTPTNITNLNGLSQITSIGGDLIIQNNSALTNIDGLSQITFIGGDLSVVVNPVLTNLDGFSQLTFVGGKLHITSHSSLTNIDGLSQVTSVGGSLWIGYTGALTNLDGLSQITSVGEFLQINYNLALTNMNGLSQITSIGGRLTIRDNDIITNVDGLSQITSVGGDLWVSDNDALINLNGLHQITAVEGRLWIMDNPQLNECCALCPLLAADAADPSVIGSGIFIEDNLIGCNSATEISACNPCAAACTVNLTLTTTEVGSNNYTAGNSLISTDSIVSGENVQYDAGNLVELQSGFSAAANTNFSAIIGGCQ